MARETGFRITGGTRRGLTLKAPATLKVRPMQGQIREALFNILGQKVQDASVLDLFSGTGSIGLEALSRGAATCAFFEFHPAPYRTLIENIRRAGFQTETRVFRRDLRNLTAFPETGFEPFNLLFLDPPFPFHDPPRPRDLSPLIHCLSAGERLANDATLILQLRKKQKPPAELGILHFHRARDYGSVTLNFYL